MLRLILASALLTFFSAPSVMAQSVMTQDEAPLASALEPVATVIEIEGTATVKNELSREHAAGN